MSKKEIELKEELLRNKQQQLSQYQEAMKRKAAEEDQLMTQTVMNDINAYLEDYGKEAGFTYILGAAGGNIVYAEDAQNITEQVLNGLNTEYKGK
jgi:outer membrane protein